jgi:hypothetical protein
MFRIRWVLLDDRGCLEHSNQSFVVSVYVSHDVNVFIRVGLRDRRKEVPVAAPIRSHDGE